MNHLPQVLRHGEWVALRDQAGRRVDCLGGSVWITQDHDRRDIVLVAGEGFVLDRPGMAVVSALADASYAVRDVAAAALSGTKDASAAAGAAAVAGEPQPCSP